MGKSYSTKVLFAGILLGQALRIIYEQYGRKFEQLSPRYKKVTNNSLDRQNINKARKFFFFQRQWQRTPNDGFHNFTSAFHTKRAREQITPNDDPRLSCSVVWSIPLHLCLTTLTSRSRRVVVDDGKSQVFRAHMRLRSSETESYRKKNIMILLQLRLF